MTPGSPATGARPPAQPLPAPAAGGQPQAPRPPVRISAGVILRLLITAAVLVLYYLYREPAVEALERAWQALTGSVMKQASTAVWLVAGLIAAMVALWWRLLQKDKRFHAPLLVTCVLLLGDAGYGILIDLNSPLLAWLTGGVITTYSPTFVTILVTVLTEMFLGRFYWGKWPHLASGYVSGISAGILIKSPELWPFLFCGLISITSKYVLRIGDRHLWNPTNFGVTMMLLLAPLTVAPLSVQAGNEVWSVLTIWVLGAMILYQLGLFHLPAVFVLMFIPLSIFRAWVEGHPVLTELAPMTSPMFQLFIFFMITDPKTITKRRWSQVLVVVVVALVDTFIRLELPDRFRVHSLFYALFTVGPIANFIEIAAARRQARQQALSAPAQAASPPFGVAPAPSQPT
jgi:hypothetical protein